MATLLWGVLLALLACKLPTHIDPDEVERCKLEAEVVVNRDHGIAPLPVEALAVSSCDEDFAALWIFEDGTTVEGNPLEHRFTSQGTHTVELALSDERGRSASTSFVVEVAPLQCPEQNPSEEVGVVEDIELTEASGLAVAGAGLFAHNDSGGEARLYAMTPTGEALVSYDLDVEAVDWEDMAASETLLFVGDIGDNEETRETVSVHVADIDDPSVFMTMTLDYPVESAYDANVLLHDPLTDDLYVISKNGALWRKPAPHLPDSETTLDFVAGLDLEGAPIAGDISPDGTQIVVGTTTESVVYLRDGGESIDAAVLRPPCELDLPIADAVAFDEGGIYSVTEGENPPLWYTGLLEPDQPCEGDGPEIWALPSEGEVPLEVHFEVDCVDVDGVTWTLEGITVEAETTDALYLASGTYPVTALVEHDGTQTELSLDVLVEPASCPFAGELTRGTENLIEDLHEASGLVESAINPGVFWTHNDAGNAAELFALDTDGVERGRIELPRSRDWESIALSEGILYVGDVGDNGRVRDEYFIYLVEEPVLSQPYEAVLDEDAVGVMTLTYPDGSHDCEAIEIDPVTGDLIVITKDYDGHSKIYVKEAPHADGDEVELTWLMDLELKEGAYSGSGAATALTFSPLGDRIGIRTYTDVWILRRDQADDLAAAFAGEPCDGGAPNEQQGEAMAFSLDGSGYWTLSEGVQQAVLFTALD